MCAPQNALHKSPDKVIISYAHFFATFVAAVRVVANEQSKQCDIGEHVVNSV